MPDTMGRRWGRYCPDWDVGVGDRAPLRLPSLCRLAQGLIVKRTLAWISSCRCLARDYERHARTTAAFVRLAMIPASCSTGLQQASEHQTRLPDGP